MEWKEKVKKLEVMYLMSRMIRQTSVAWIICVHMEGTEWKYEEVRENIGYLYYELMGAACSREITCLALSDDGLRKNNDM